jgi:hypothetical protein
VKSVTLFGVGARFERCAVALGPAFVRFLAFRARSLKKQKPQRFSALFDVELTLVRKQQLPGCRAEFAAYRQPSDL